MSDRYFLTTAIDYANGEPHIGHAYEKIGADAIARYRRMRGDDVHFLIGMDEHGQKVEQTAAQQGIAPQALVDSLAARFAALWRRLGDLQRPVHPHDRAAHHKAGVVAFIARIFERNPDDFYEKAYEGWYCVGCEAFKQDAEIVDGKCVLHPTRVLEWVEERNWFFPALAVLRLPSRAHRRAPAVRPAGQPAQRDARAHRPGTRGHLRRAARDWRGAFPSQAVELGRGADDVRLVRCAAELSHGHRFPGQTESPHWPAQLHVVGKDITRFHTIIWPAMLQAAELPLPERVWGHGFVLLGGERFSKSAGCAARSRRGDRQVRRRRVPVFSAPRSSLRRRWRHARRSPRRDRITRQLFFRFTGTSMTTPLRQRSGGMYQQQI